MSNKMMALFLAVCILMDFGFFAIGHMTAPMPEDAMHIRLKRGADPLAGVVICATKPGQDDTLYCGDAVEWLKDILGQVEGQTEPKSTDEKL